MTRNVILSGAQQSEESRCETSRPFASLRVTGGRVAQVLVPGSEGQETSRASCGEQAAVSCASRTGSENLCHPPHPSPCSPCLRVSDDKAVEDALLQSALNGSIRAQVFWLVNRAPYKWQPVWRIRVAPRLPSLASMLNVSEPRLREWAHRTRSARSLSARRRPAINTETRSARRRPKRSPMIPPLRALRASVFQGGPLGMARKKKRPGRGRARPCYSRPAPAESGRPASSPRGACRRCAPRPRPWRTPRACARGRDSPSRGPRSRSSGPRRRTAPRPSA